MNIHSTKRTVGTFVAFKTMGYGEKRTEGEQVEDGRHGIYKVFVLVFFWEIVPVEAT